jgi:queuosine precursor transporter
MITLHNESIFIIHVILLCFSASVALRLGVHALIALMATQAILSNLLVTKQMVLCGLSVTCTDAFAVGASLTLNLIQEHYGIRQASHAIAVSFLCLVFFVCMGEIHLWYLPDTTDTMHTCFVQLFASSLRVVSASLISYGLSQKLESFLYAYFTRIFNHQHFIIRNYSSLAISQCVDTALFSVLALYGVVTHVWHVFLVGYSIKLITIFLAAPLMALAHKIVGKEPIS